MKDGIEIVIGLNVHNCQYIAHRNTLIREATKLTNEKRKVTDSTIESSWWDGKPIKINLWSREFTSQMEKLARSKEITHAP